VDNLLKKIILDFIKKWLLPAGLRIFLSSYVERRAHRDADSRRFWKGEPVASPIFNIPYFWNLEKNSRTYTLSKESRDAVVLKKNESLTLDITIEADEDEVECGFGVTESSREGVELRIGDIVAADLRHITPTRWHSVSFRLKRGVNRLSILNRDNQEVMIVHPTIKCSYKKSAGHTNPTEPARDGIKNIILIVLDALPRDSIGSYRKDEKSITPNIDRFFSNSLKYSKAFVQSEWTLPSVYSFMTSQYSIEHGMYDLNLPFESLKSDDQYNLAKEFKKLGFVNMAYSTVKVFHPGFNAHVGFDKFFYDPFPQNDNTYLDLGWQAITQLESNREGKNFVYLHYLDTHEPWTNATELGDAKLSGIRITDPMIESKKYRVGHIDTKGQPIYSEEGIAILNRRRDARLYEVDLALQSLFDYLEKSKQLDETVVALVSDHGCLYLGRDKPLLCDTRVNVPLLIRHPKLGRAIINDLVAVNLDLGPTLLSFAGKDEHFFNSGQLLSPFTDELRDYVISESIFGNIYKISVRNDEYIYHYGCEFNHNDRSVNIDKKIYELLHVYGFEAGQVDLSPQEPEVRDYFNKVMKSHIQEKADCC